MDLKYLYRQFLALWGTLTVKDNPESGCFKLGKGFAQRMKCPKYANLALA